MTPVRRRIKVRGGTLGPFLCWAVVFADIGTSIYYVPGILYGQFGTRSAIFVLMTLCVFVLLCIKYAEVTWRYPEGGGVVNVSSQALHPFAGLLGGLFILVDYYLTAALSAVSGAFYLAVVIPGMSPQWIIVTATVIALIGLGVLNFLGIKESARTTAVFVCLAAGGQMLIVVATAIYLGPAGIMHSFTYITSGPVLSPLMLITGYAAAFLAFSGLESIAQLAPAMRAPRKTVATRAMTAVVLTMAITSPLLTLWSTTLLNGTNPDPNQFISLLGAHVAGQAVADYVAVSGALLLVFASNTAIIGAYHVFIALGRMGFLPRAIERRNQLRRTPHWAILAAVAMPIAIAVAAQGSPQILGDLYAFGLLGTFVLTCVSLDLVRWRERRQWSGLQASIFVIGVATTALVIVAWIVNIFAKPYATGFGGGLTVIGLVIGFATYRYYRNRRPAVFPLPFRPHRVADSLAAMRSMTRPGDVLVILPHEQMAAEAVIAEAARAAAGKGAVFLYRGNRYPHQHHELLEVSDPYLKDYSAHDAFARAEMLTRDQVPNRRFVYVPGSLPREWVGEVWRTISPKETVVSADDHAMIPPIAIDRIRRHHADGTTVLHMYSSHLRRVPEAAAS